MKMRNIIYSKKHNCKFIIGLVLGLILASTGVYAVTSITGSNVTYSNSKSGLTSTNVQGAIDELYERSDIRKADRFVAAYTYSESGINKCITGEESTCQRTNCYKNKTANSCPAGTIIKYKVNDTDIINFHVMFDEKNTITMQSQKNTISHIAWTLQKDYEQDGGTLTDWSGYGNNNRGPLTTLPVLEKATASWTNVNNQTYTLGTTSFSGKGAYTGCDKYNSCTANTYTLPERTAKARIITVQESVALGCSNGGQTCPRWMINYLQESTINGGTVDILSLPKYLWTMNAHISDKAKAWIIHQSGDLSNNHNIRELYGIRAVVIVSK